jgi:hypothetical protein
LRGKLPIEHLQRAKQASVGRPLGTDFPEACHYTGNAFVARALAVTFLSREVPWPTFAPNSHVETIDMRATSALDDHSPRQATSPSMPEAAIAADDPECLSIEDIVVRVTVFVRTPSPQRPSRSCERSAGRGHRYLDHMPHVLRFFQPGLGDPGGAVRQRTASATWLYLRS